MTEQEFLALARSDPDKANALVATEVMGFCNHTWRWDDSVKVSPSPGWLHSEDEEYLPDYAWKCTRCNETHTADYPSLKPTDGGNQFKPTSEIAPAWQVVEKMTSTTKQWFRLEMSCVTHEVIFEVSGAGCHDFTVKAEAESAPLAICRV